MKISCDQCGVEFTCLPSNFSRYQKHFCSVQCKYKYEKQFAPNMEQFKLELWEKPITELALDYDISVKTIHKFCKNHKLPKPGRGYWQKKEAGLI